MTDLTLIKVNHITISAPPEAEKKIRWFYEEVLGFKEMEHPSTLNQKYKVIWYDRPPIRLHIDLTPPFVEVGLARHFAIEVDDIKAAREYFNSKGVQIKEDVPVPYCHRFDIVDPVGNYIEIMELKEK